MWESCLCYSLVLILPSALEDARILPACVHIEEPLRDPCHSKHSCSWVFLTITRAPWWTEALRGYSVAVKHSVLLGDNHHPKRVINADLEATFIYWVRNQIQSLFSTFFFACLWRTWHGDCSSVFFSMPNTLHGAVFYVFLLIFKATGWWRAWMWDCNYSNQPG